MSLTNPFSTKTARVSRITAAEINNAGTAISQAVDGTGGGSYTPLAPISIGGAQGLQIEDDSKIAFQSGGAITGTLALSATTTASDLTMSGTNRVKLASRSIQRVMPYFALSRVAGGVDDWSPAHLGRHTNVTLNGLLYIPLRVPHGATLTAVEVYIQGASGHGDLPENMPLINLHTVSIDDDEVSIADTFDPSGSVPDFQDVHPIPLTGLSHVVDRVNQRLVILMNSESGTNALAGARYIGSRVTYTPTAYDED
jgi:hypothetical protein